MKLLRLRVSMLALCAGVVSVYCHRAAAAPFVPTRDDVVVETLREKPLDEEERVWRALKAAWRLQPNDLGVSLQLARSAIERARREGDPRLMGTAQAALAPWWAAPKAPAAVMLLRATIRQSTHDFESALLDLNALLSNEARTPQVIAVQARFTRASVYQVLAQYPQAQNDCTALLMAAPIEAGACLAELRSLTDVLASKTAAHDLAALYAQASPLQRGWLSLMQAELAERMGQSAQADRFYRQALAADASSYTLGAYADFLIDHARAAEVPALLKDKARIDPLLLRLALAWQATGDAPRADQARRALQARFDAAHARGDKVHLREEARFMLTLAGKPVEALALAKANWAVQKEPADAKLLAQCVQAANKAANQAKGASL